MRLLNSNKKAEGTGKPDLKASIEGQAVISHQEIANCLAFFYVIDFIKCQGEKHE